MKKIVKGFKFYLIATQGLLTMVILAGIGMLIGYKIDKDSIWPGLLGGIGVILGVGILISYLLFLLKKEGDKNETGK